MHRPRYSREGRYAQSAATIVRARDLCRCPAICMSESLVRAARRTRRVVQPRHVRHVRTSSARSVAGRAKAKRVRSSARRDESQRMLKPFFQIHIIWLSARTHSETHPVASVGSHRHRAIMRTCFQFHTCIHQFEIDSTCIHHHHRLPESICAMHASHQLHWCMPPCTTCMSSRYC